MFERIQYKCTTRDNVHVESMCVVATPNRNVGQFEKDCRCLLTNAQIYLDNFWAHFRMLSIILHPQKRVWSMRECSRKLEETTNLILQKLLENVLYKLLAEANIRLNVHVFNDIHQQLWKFGSPSSTMEYSAMEITSFILQFLHWVRAGPLK